MNSDSCLSAIFMKLCDVPKRRALLVVAFATLLTVAYGRETPSAISFSFTSFDFPGATSTQSVGINSSGTLVGSYSDSAGIAHGFISEANGKFIAVDFPGAISTVLERISDSNQAVGFYVDSNNITHGFSFVYPNQFTELDYPGATQTQAYGIAKTQEIVGTWFDSQGNQSGFSLVQGSYMDIVYPKSLITLASDVNANGIISGSWGNTDGQSQSHGFLLSAAGMFTDVDYPKAMKTLIYGLNDLSQVAGTYFDAKNVQHGWVGYPAKNEYLTEDFPGSTSCYVGSITNLYSNITGGYTDGNGQMHGFIACPKPADSEPLGKGGCPGIR